MSNISGSSKKVRNSNRTPGYWVTLANSRSHRDRVFVNHPNRDLVRISDVGSAAYRRLGR